VINKDSLEIIDFGDVCPDDFHPKFNEIFDNHIYIYPIDRSGIERKWRYARQSVESIKSMLKVKKTKEGYDRYWFPCAKNRLNQYEGCVLHTRCFKTS
jgi:adenine-specific DNA-methyltransferase